MIRQDSPALYGARFPFKAYGCKVLSYFFWVEQLLNVEVNAGFVKTKTDELFSAGVIGADLTVKEKNETSVPQGLGLPVIGSHRTDPHYLCAWNEVEILWLWKNTASGEYNHFVPGDGRGAYVWDSLGIRRGRDDYSVRGKRVMVLEPRWCRLYWREKN